MGLNIQIAIEDKLDAALARVNELEAALKPFADFHARGAAWKGTAWEHQPWSAHVLVDHQSGRSITLDDFATAERAIRNLSEGLPTAETE